MSDQDISFEVVTGAGGNVGMIVLDRIRVLNALSLSMLQQISVHMSAWQQDDSIKAVIIKSSSARVFCAGGDIRYIYQNRHQDFSKPHPYFKTEYEFNQFLYHFKKPYIALCDGLTMGGGVGISIHGSHRVATDSMTWAMPETKIGFFPDVGVSYYLAKCPDYSGYYLALSGRSIDAATALDLDLVDYVVPSTRLVELEQQIINTHFGQDANKSVDQVIMQFKQAVSPSCLQQYFPLMRRCFSLKSVPEIFSALELECCDWSNRLLDELKQRSPLSLYVTYSQLNKVLGMSIDDVMEQDTSLVHHFLQGHDFYEGTRALIIDKDNAPVWQPASMDDVTDNMVKTYFMCS
jgi:enoyl-CoA hydratase